MATFTSIPHTVNAWPVSHLLSDARNNWNGLPKVVRDAYEKGDIIFAATYIIAMTSHGKKAAGSSSWLVDREAYLCFMTDSEFRANYDVTSAKEVGE